VRRFYGFEADTPGDYIYAQNYQTGQATLTPDVASSIVQGLLPSLNKVNALAEYHLVPGGTAPISASMRRS
jgi:hypothetical protein